MPVRRHPFFSMRPSSASSASSEEFYTEPVGGSSCYDPSGSGGGPDGATICADGGRGVVYASTPSVWKSRDEHIYESAPSVFRSKEFLFGDRVASGGGRVAGGGSSRDVNSHIYESLADVRREKERIRLRNRSRNGNAADRLRRLSLDVTRQLTGGLASLARQVVARARAKAGEEEDDYEARPVISSPVSVTRRRSTPLLAVPRFESEESTAGLTGTADQAITIIRREAERPRVTPPATKSATAVTFHPGNGSGSSTSSRRLATLPEDSDQFSNQPNCDQPCDQRGSLQYLPAALRRKDLHRRSLACVGDHYGRQQPEQQQHQQQQQQQQFCSPGSARRRLDYDTRCLHRRSVAVMEAGGGGQNYPPNGCE